MNKSRRFAHPLTLALSPTKMGERENLFSRLRADVHKPIALQAMVVQF